MSGVSNDPDPAILRGTIDLGDLKHYVWKSPTGQAFDLLLDAEVTDGRMILREAHIMPQSGTFAESQRSLGMTGLRQLLRDLGTTFGANVVEIPHRIGRTTGRTGGFGPVIFPVRSEKLLKKRGQE